MKNEKSILVKKSYKFSLDIIAFCQNLPKERVFWIISDQLLRSSTSIGANIIEGQSSSSKKDFARFFQIALKSANESEYWIGLLIDSELTVDKVKLNILLAELQEICRILAKSLLTMKNKG
ncbi:MAG: four helix bundle protein [Candidatus Berkelbacteria bacterium]